MSFTGCGDGHIVDYCMKLLQNGYKLTFDLSCDPMFADVEMTE